MTYIIRNPGIILGLLVDHVLLSGMALLISALIALPIGILIARRERLASIVLVALSTLYTIPSIALIILLLPVFGLNGTSVVVALVVYSQVILVRNLIAGLRSIDPVLLEAAKGMGMNIWQRLWRVEIPLALPVMLAGMRIAAVVTIAIATIGAKFGAGGLGTLLFDGIAQAGRYDKIWAGAIVVSALALVVNKLLLNLEKTSHLPTPASALGKQRQRLDSIPMQ